MKTKKAVYNEKLNSWICGCGSGLLAVYNSDDKYACQDEDLVCSHCFFKEVRESWKERKKERIIHCYL